MTSGQHLAWEPIRRSNLSEEIADRLIKSILDGDYRFGERLPPERDIAKFLDVGRPSVREAIRILTVLGLVEVRPGEGTFVVREHATFVAKAFSWAALLDAQTIQDVVETRTAIESELAGLAAMRAPNGDIDALAAHVAEMVESKGDAERFSAADVSFHFTVASLAKNTTLSRLLFATQSLLRDWIVRALADPSTYARAVQQHQDIADCVALHDPTRARAAMRRHLEDMGTLLLKPDSSPAHHVTLSPAAPPGSAR